MYQVSCSCNYTGMDVMPKSEENEISSQTRKQNEPEEKEPNADNFLDNPKRNDWFGKLRWEKINKHVEYFNCERKVRLGGGFNLSNNSIQCNSHRKVKRTTKAKLGFLNYRFKLLSRHKHAIHIQFSSQRTQPAKFVGYCPKTMKLSYKERSWNQQLTKGSMRIYSSILTRVST